MSYKEKIHEKLNKRRQLDSELITLLLNNPNCLDGDLQKKEAYQVAVDYFVVKEEESQSTVKGNPALSGAIKLTLLIDCYAHAAQNDRQEYARKIASFLLQTPVNWLKPIPEETRDVAFDIVMQYLETQMGS